MATALEEIGEPVLGAGYQINLQVARGGLSDRTVTRQYKCRVADVNDYTVNILAPTLYDTKYPLAVIVDQRFAPKDKVDGVLTRVFAEVPSEWNDPDDRVIPFPGVALSSLYAPGDFAFRSAQSSLRTDVRINHVYFLTADQRSIPRYPKFKVFDYSGLQTSVVTDYTTPTADEYIALVAGQQEIVIDCQIVSWRGAIFDRQTTFAAAQ